LHSQYDLKELEQLLWDKYGAAPDFTAARKKQLKEDRIRQAEEAGVDEAEIKTKAEEVLLEFYQKNDPTKIAAVSTILEQFELEELAKLLKDKYGQMPAFSQVPGFVYRGIDTVIVEEDEEDEEDEEGAENAGEKIERKEDREDSNPEDKAERGVDTANESTERGLDTVTVMANESSIPEGHAVTPEKRTAVTCSPTHATEQEKITR
jgi:hypothetical protein